MLPGPLRGVQPAPAEGGQGNLSLRIPGAYAADLCRGRPAARQTGPAGPGCTGAGRRHGQAETVREVQEGHSRGGGGSVRGSYWIETMVKLCVGMQFSFRAL